MSWVQVLVTVATTLVGGYVFFVRELGNVERRLTEGLHALDVRLARLEERFAGKAPPATPAE